MYVFAVAGLLGLGVFAVATFAHRFLSMVRELWPIVLVGLGVGAAWLVNFDAFRLWGIGERQHWIGVTLTGVMIGGFGVVYRGVGHLMGAFARKVADEAESIEKEKGIRRVA